MKFMTYEQAWAYPPKHGGYLLLCCVLNDWSVEHTLKNLQEDI